MQFIIFRLGSEYFATETEKIQNISDIMQITKVPTAPSYIKGLINLRGSIKPLVDIGMLLNIKNQSENQNIIILKLDEEEVGIAVDEVIEVADIDLNMLQNTSIDSKEYIKGVIEFNKYLLTVIDINKIVNIYGGSTISGRDRCTFISFVIRRCRARNYRFCGRRHT